MKKSSLYFVLIATILFSDLSHGYCQIPDGGTEMIRDASSYYTKIGKGTLSLVTIENQPFTKAFRYITPSDVVNPWDSQIKFQSISGIKANDVILVAFYARTIASAEETGEGLLNVVIENSTSYAKVLYHNVIIGTEWRQYYAPVKTAVSLETTNLNCAIFLGFASQTIEVADIRFLNYSTTKTLEEMPQTEISYIGREEDAPWRAEAQERIEQIRMGNIEITVLDTFGNPLPGAEVKLSMTRQKFSFGSAIVASEYLANSIYREKIHELFNEVVFENDLKWPSFNSKTLAQKNQLLEVIDDLATHNIGMRGHNVVWPSWKFLPAYLSNLKNDPDRLRLDTDKHIDEICTFTRGRLVDWDVINEPYSEHDLMDKLGREVMADWFKRVRNNDPYAKLYLNDYAILSSNGTNYPKQDAYIETARFIDELGGGVDGIGLQGHFSSILTPIPRLKTVLDKFSVLEKEIKITEFDIAINQQDVQADYTRDFLTMVFSHPSVEGILLWGFWESRHWEPNAAMYTKDWTIKPNGLVYNDLVLNKWRTRDTTLVTDASGLVTLNGFLGTYTYTIHFDGKESTGSLSVNLPVSGGVPNEFILSADPSVPAELTLEVTGETFLCEGESTDLSVNVPEGFTLKWFNTGTELPETASSITVGSAGNYYVEATGKGIVVKSNRQEIIVNSFPEVSIEASGELSFCPGGSVTLNSNQEVPFTYKWYKNGTFFYGSLPQITVAESGIYKVEVNSSGCSAFSPEINNI